MKEFLRKLRTRLTTAVTRVHPFVLLIMCIGVLLAYLLGMHVTGRVHSASRWMGAMLACTSVVVVLQHPVYKDSLRTGGMRVLGTFLGALVAYLYLSVLPFTVAGMLAAVCVLETLFMLLNIYNNGHIATMTMLIILLVSQITPHVSPLMNCTLRFFESAVGVGVGIGLLWLIEVWNRFRSRLLRMGGNPDGHPVDMDTMPLRWGHFRVLIVASLGQLTGAALSTLVGIILPMIRIVHDPALSSMQQGIIACAALAGITAGSLLFGAWSDRRGYLFLFRFCPALILFASLAVTLTHDLRTLIVGLFLMGAGIGGGYTLDSDYISEIMPRRWRLTMVGIAKSFSALGSILVAGLCVFLLRDWSPSMWNRLPILVSILAVVMLLCRTRFAQSPGWLAAHGRTADAEKAVRYFLGPDVVLGDLATRTSGPKTPSARLFRRGNFRKIVLSGLPWACEGAGVYGIGIFLPVLILSLGLGAHTGDAYARLIRSVELTAVINLFILPGFVLGLLLLGRVCHVRLQSWGFLLCAAGLGVLLLADRYHLPLWSAVAGFTIFELFLNAGPHLVTFILPAQIYPVADRGTGAGVAAACGKLGALASVLFIPLLLEHGGATAVLLAVLGLQLVGGAVTALLGRRILPCRKRDADPS